MFRKCLLVDVVLTSLMLLPCAANAGDNPVERPMKLTGMGLLVSHLSPSDPDHPWIFDFVNGTFAVPWRTEETGTATHLGDWQAVCEGWIVGRIADGEWLEMWGDWEITADNGDKLLATVTWPSYPNFTQLAATVTFHGGSGRFEGATGTLDFACGYTGEQWWEGTDHYSIFWETVEGTIVY